MKEVIDFCTTDNNQISNSFQGFNTIINIDYIDYVAKMKFIAYFVSKLIIRCYDLRRDYMHQFFKLTTSDAAQQNIAIPFEIRRLIGVFRSLSNEVPEKLTLYLFKCMFYQLGWAGLKSLVNNNALIWILPKDYRDSKYVSYHYYHYYLMYPMYLQFKTLHPG